MRSPRLATAIAVAVGAVVTALLAGSPVRAPDRYASAAAPIPGNSRPAHTALFVGDSFLAGAAGVDPSDTFAWQACERLGWVCNVDAENGTGYVADGRDDSPANGPYPTRLADDRRLYVADVVVVTGGRSDLGEPGLTEAARAYLTALRAAFPRAEVLVFEPFWRTDVRGTGPARVRDAVHDAARQAGVTWVPTAGWLPPALISPVDGIHPTDEGHTYLATLTSRALAAAVTPR